MKKIFIALLFLTTVSFINAQTSERVVLGYFPSWSENWTTTNQNSKLREVPNFVNHIFLSFAKPNLTYTLGSYDISGTGIETPYDGCALKESVSALNDKGIKVILSIGGETYWGSSEAYDINYQEIKDLVDDMGFAGIDWDFEPNGSFATIGNAENVQHFIDFFTNSRAIMPRSEGYVLACAPSGVGALGGQLNNDPNSPFAFANRNALTGESDTNLYNGPAITNGINLFGFTATGHMIPVFQSVGDKIDLVAYQGYNAGGSTNRSIMYDAFAYYAEQYGFLIAAGVHYPNEPWGPYYEYTHTNVASLSTHIQEHPTRSDDNDGLMIWQILLENSSNNSSAYSYMNVSSLVFNGSSETAAIQNANNYSLSPYTGGAEGCSSGGGGNVYCGIQAYNPSNAYPNSDTQVYYECKIWHNQWYANPNEIPGVNAVWVFDSDCNEGVNCEVLAIQDHLNKNIKIYPIPSNDFIQISGLDTTEKIKIYNALGIEVLKNSISNKKINIQGLTKGIYFLKFKNGHSIKFIKE
jgi:chitinase